MKTTRNRNRRQKHSSRAWDHLESWHQDLDPETKKSIFAVISFVVALLLVLSSLGRGGEAGGYVSRGLGFLLGKGYFLAPLVAILIGFSFLFSGRRKVVAATLVGGALFLLTALAGFDVLLGATSGGMVGAILGAPLLAFFDVWASVIILVGLLAISVLLMANVPLWRMAPPGEAEEAGRGTTGDAQEPARTPEGGSARAEAPAAVRVAASPLGGEVAGRGLIGSRFGTGETRREEFQIRKLTKSFGYKKPPLELLQGDSGTPSSGDIKANANIIKRTLLNFGVDVEMGEVAIGPTVTQYTLRPAEGVKLSRIVALSSDLSLALAAHPIRIEAPIPGKSFVGIEVPNRSMALVGLRSLLEHEIFRESHSPLLFALGRDVAGMPVFADLAKMPHLLIGGATGTGKSVSVHSIITSFVCQNPPEILRFILIDPKRVELSVYNDIPHILTPVITDPKTAIASLRWGTKEMERRYDLLSGAHARDIASFNIRAAKAEDSDSLLPYIIIIIDELADLMAVFPREMESAIIRLAQMARAVGIHLVVSTQRPSVDVITGLIKANITSRIAFQVASQVDSRTILDMAGAERLLGNGDMLFLAGDTAKPRRIQGAYVSEQEVKRAVGFLRKTASPEYEEDILETGAGEKEEWEEERDVDDDTLYEEARILVMEAGKASASYLQRRLRIGYARAARLLDTLEERGIIGPADGAKPRDVLVRTAHFEEARDEEIG